MKKDKKGIKLLIASVMVALVAIAAIWGMGFVYNRVSEPRMIYLYPNTSPEAFADTLRNNLGKPGEKAWTLMKLLGVETLLVSNAAGGVNFGFKVGDLMIIKDQINLLPNPLIGANLDEFGTRFPDMTTCYREDLRKVIRQSALELGINLREGVYVMLTGPQYETPEEVRLLEYLGGDVVGMSSVTEALAGNHMGLKICGLTSVGNMGAGITGEKLEHGAHAGEVIDDKFARLVTRSIVNIAKTL